MPCSPCSLLSPALAANGRVALVVGNGAYRTVPALLNPVRDADAVARTLGEAGFEVLLATDLDLASLRERIYAFAAKVEAGGAEGTAVLFFAGHAVQLNGTNYLLPVDAQLMAAKDAPAQALALSDILKRLDSTRAGTKIVILDACRDNPFPSGSETGRGLALVGGTGGEGEAGEAGLARIESKGGTLVAFSTSPGATASDGEGASSPYAGALLDHMGESGLAVEAVFRRVRVAVQQATNREQTPWETSSLTREFTFFGAGPDPSAGAVSSSFSRRAFEVSATRGVLARRSVDEAYEIAVHADTIEGYRAFLDVYSDDARALRLHRMVLLRLEETAWIEAVRAGDAASLAAFGRMFPGSHHTAEARRLLATAPARAVVQTASLGCPVLPVAPPAPPRPRAPTLLRRVRLEPAPAAEERSPARVSPARAAPPEPARVLPVRVRPEPVATPVRARLESPAIVPLRPRPEPKAEAPPNRGPTRAEPAAAEPVRGRAVHRVPVPVVVETEEPRRPPRINVPGRLVRLPVIRRHVPRPHRPVVVVDPPGETRNPDRYDGGEPPVHGNPRFDGRLPGRMGVSDRFRPVRTFGGRFPGGGGPSPERFHGGGRSAPTRLAPIGPHEPRMHGPGHRRGAFLERGFSPSGDFVGGMFLRYPTGNVRLASLRLTSPLASPPGQSVLPRMLVRPFRPGDEDACAGIFNRAWAGALPDVPRQMDGREFLNQTRGEEVLIAEADGRLLGFAAVYRPDAFIHHLFVEPAFQRRGVGGALLDCALALAGGSATLKCLRRNEGAWAFYARAGWREVEQGADEWGSWGRFAMRTGAAEG